MKKIKTNKKLKRKVYSNQTGITLIALVVTIVILLILAGVSINALFGDNGIIQKAKDAQNKMDEARNSDLNTLNDLANFIENYANNSSGTITDDDIDSYEDGDYSYSLEEGKWTVSVKDTTKSSYGPILSEIAGKPVTNMEATFMGCKSLTTAPEIPNSVTNMSNTFAGCKSLTTAPTIPSSVTNMESAFSQCTSLTTPPTIPNSVTNMEATFYGCTSLTTPPTIPEGVTTLEGTFHSCTSLIIAPTIPNSVTNMSITFFDCTALTTVSIIPENVTILFDTFCGCKSLTGTIEINANPTDYAGCFWDTEKTITLTGSSTILNEIAQESANGNVTIKK